MAPHTHTNEVTRHFNGHRSEAQIRNVNIGHKDGQESGRIFGRGEAGRQGVGGRVGGVAQCLVMSFWPW